MSKKVELMFKAPGPHPNGMQAVSDGLWLLDQRTNQIFKVSFDDGSVLLTLETKSDRGSGITDAGGELWVSSTYSREILKINKKDKFSLLDKACWQYQSGVQVKAYKLQPTPVLMLACHGNASSMFYLMVARCFSSQYFHESIRPVYQQEIPFLNSFGKIFYARYCGNITFSSIPEG